jgi:hypothetical protein
MLKYLELKETLCGLILGASFWILMTAVMAICGK